MKALATLTLMMIMGTLFGAIQPKTNVNQLKERAYWKSIVEGKLVSQGRYICLQKKIYAAEDLENFKEMEVENKPSSIMRFFELPPEEQNKYQALQGKTIFITNPTRGSVEATIKRLFLVSDLWDKEIYIAAEFSLEEADKYGYYCAYASVHPPVLEAEYLKEDVALELFDQVKREKFYVPLDTLSNQEHAEYEELEVTEIKWEDRNFVVVQNRVMGVCGSIVASQVVVYEDVKGVLKVNSHFLTEDYVNGLVDTDQDGHMEVVLVSLASTGIYELKSNKLREKVHLSWSFDGCPC